MSVIQKNEIRIRETNDTRYYVLGDNVRQVLIHLTQALKDEPTPKKWNKFDADALATMDKWLREERDFNDAQWVKFSKMLKKFNIPATMSELVVAMNWTIGDPLSAGEMFQVMEDRRKNSRRNKVRTLRQKP